MRGIGTITTAGTMRRGWQQAAVLVLCAAAIGAAAACDRGDTAGSDRTRQEYAGHPADAGQVPYYYGLIEEYQRILAEDPHNLAAVTALGNAYYDAGQWREAIEYYDRALQLNPHDVDVIADMGMCYRNMGLADRAVAEFQRALRIEPTNQDSLFNIGLVYALDLHDYAKAIRYWEELLQVAPKHPQAEALHASIEKYRRKLRRKNQ